ncbi:MAG: Gfo/Idh/MocA family oxidoreductase [Planctomyces sp.]|nr:Gfo/Idh/MocA family oxidoreductase [Planctomyces sp.]
MSRLNRRDFLYTATAAATVSGTVVSGLARQASPADRINVAVIGNGGQGRAHISSYLTLADVNLVAVCDVDETRLAEAQKLAPNAKAISDFRRLLDDRTIDAVSIATPDHWHTPAALMALSAGKHVYVEKPCSHNVREGRWLVEAAKNSGRVVQHGTQSRSAEFIQAAVEILRAGTIGDIVIARAWDVQFRPPIGRAQPGEVPKGFDYDTWTGPAPLLPFQSNRHHYSWHWWHAFGTGDAGNDGVHEIDIARWGLGVNTHPHSVSAAGGKYIHQDDQEFPDTMTAVFEYPGIEGQVARRQLIFEMRLWSHYHPNNIDNGNEFLGTRGRMLLTKRGKLEVFDEKGGRIDVKLPDSRSVSVASHQQNFIQAIRTGSPVNADAATGHLSSTLPHLGNIACRIGRGFRFDAETETIPGDDEANALLGRSYRSGGHWGVPAEAGGVG